jgi:hypothetical protein
VPAQISADLLMTGMQMHLAHGQQVFIVDGFPTDAMSLAVWRATYLQHTTGT